MESTTARGLRLRNGVPLIWPWCYGADEGPYPRRMVHRARRTWPEFSARQVEVAEYMVATSAEFWEACAIVLGVEGDFHVCPKCGHGWPDKRVVLAGELPDPPRGSSS